MALTESNMMELGAQAPDFELPDTRTGKPLALQDGRGDAGTLVAFICNHCPYVLHVVEAFVQLAADYQSQGIQTLAISSNDIDTHPEDSPERMREFAQKHQFGFPYLYDETQQVAMDYQAACTPEFYLFDAELKCVYRGRMDSARPGNSASNDGADLRAAMDALLAGKPINSEQFPSAGCNIKWKRSA